MTTQKALEQSIFWQQHVVNTSRDPKQIARCKAAIEKLQQQLKALIA